VPLCKELNINTVVSGSINRNGGRSLLNESNKVTYYCANLLSSFGIKLIYNIIDKDTDTEVKNILNINTIEEQGDCYPCIFRKNYQLLHGMWKEPSNLNQFFERFLIPAVAKIISKVLSGREFEYNNDVMDVLMPGIKKNKKK
jgi:hypothetical protein